MNISNNAFTNLRTKYTPPVTDEGKQGEEANGAKEETEGRSKNYASGLKLSEFDHIE